MPNGRPPHPLFRNPFLSALFLLGLLIILGVLFRLQTLSAARTAAYDATLSAASLSSSAVHLWLEERRADADAVAASPLFRHALLLETERSGSAAPSFVNSPLQQHLELTERATTTAPPCSSTWSRASPC